MSSVDEEYDNDVKVIYMEGDKLRIIKAKFIEEEEGPDGWIMVERRATMIKIPRKNIERTEYFKME